METNYFLIIGGQQVGPLSLFQLRDAGITVDTPVWRIGLADWVKASTLPELSEVLTASTPDAGYGQPPVYDHNPYGESIFNNGLPVAHTNWLPWAIVGTVLGALCCLIGLIFGILGIINASKANRFYNEGNRMMGDSANSTARINTIISLVFGCLAIPMVIYVLSSSMEILSSVALP
ncbi:MAG: DUF4339 domain-containing protein [Bacteroides sp.]|nr:DUF4339 domain-containing protein [Bacteroides sp.]